MSQKRIFQSKIPQTSRFIMSSTSISGRIGFSLFAIIIAATFASGFREFQATVWIYEILSIGAFCFAIITLVYRAKTVTHRGWRRAALVASAVGAVLTEVLFFEPIGLSALGQVIAFVILMGWGVLSGLLFVEGLRWVEKGFLEEQAL